MTAKKKTPPKLHTKAPTGKVVEKMKCPYCDAPLTLCQDAIIGFPLIKIDKKIKKCAPDLVNINYLQSCWVECSDCGRSSVDDDTFSDIMRTIDPTLRTMKVVD